MRLIDADALKEKATLRHGYDFQGVFVKVQDIDKAPTVDAVEVVRCKDCKYSYGNKYCTNDAWKDEGNTVRIEPDDFCSYGERKEAGHGE